MGYDSTAEVSRQRHGGKHSYAAQFAEVAVSDVTGEVRVRRMLGVFAAGRILNPRTTRSQFLGAMTMGLGMALMEECALDEAVGASSTTTWPSTTCRCADVGEIGLVGTPAAIANAVRHACGVRVRELPVRLDRVLAGLRAQRGR